MPDRAAQLRTLATSFYRELMRLADEMDAEKKEPRQVYGGYHGANPAPGYPRRPEGPGATAAMDPALDS